MRDAFGIAPTASAKKSTTTVFARATLPDGSKVLVGAARICLNENVLEILLLATNKDYEKQGVASAIIAHIMLVAKKLECKGVATLVTKPLPHKALISETHFVCV